MSAVTAESKHLLVIDDEWIVRTVTVGLLEMAGYTVEQAEGAHDVEVAAFELLKERWDEINSQVLFLFKTRTMEELQSEAGLRMLDHDLIQELDRTAFGDHGEGKITSVTRILWAGMLLQ